MKYIKLAVIISAMIWDGSNTEELEQFMDDKNYYFSDEDCSLYILTLEGDLKANTGDYIIQGIKGEFYPCKPDIFKKTYVNVHNGTFDWGTALTLSQLGYPIQREGWNGKGMFVVYQKGYPEGIPCNKNTAEAWNMHEGELFKCEPYLQIKMVNGSHAMWVPSINDNLAKDWKIYKGEDENGK